MFNNDHLQRSLAKLRQEELWEEAQRRRQVLEYKRHRPGFQHRLVRKFAALWIALGLRV
jgi:hypothetical protein